MSDIDMTFLQYTPESDMHTRVMSINVDVSTMFAATLYASGMAQADLMSSK